MTPSFILALDQGTTSSRAIVFDHAGRVRSVARREFRQFYPQPGWVEHDPDELITSQLSAAREAIADAGISAGDIAAIGLTNQRETTLVWDRQTARPVHNAIVWQDRRTAETCERLRRDGHEQHVRSKSGLVIDPYFSATKIGWILDQKNGLRRRAERGELAFGTVDSWLLLHLTGRHAIDPTNAARTLLYNIHTGQWDDDLLRMFGVPRAMLPPIVPSCGVAGETKRQLFGRPIPVAGIAGDQQAALYGQTCFERGHAKCTYGTGCFVLAHTSTHAVTSRHQLLTTTTADGGFALEGSVFVGGAVVQWLRDGLGLIKSADEIEALATSVADSGGVYIVPAFTGLGAPHWDPHARGTICGITRGTTAAHLARAAVESIAFQVADVVDAMRADVPVTELRVDGGACSNNALMQFQADLLGLPIVRPETIETTALGAAYLAGLAVGFWKDEAEIRANAAIDRVFEPAVPTAVVAERRGRWSEAVRRSLRWDIPT